MQEPEPGTGRLLKDCVASYLAETEVHKAETTFEAYSLALSGFNKIVRREFIEEITREDLLAFAAALKKKGNAPRTVRNRIAGVLANNRDNLSRWIRHPQQIHPGTAMPEMQISSDDARRIARYLEFLH